MDFFERDAFGKIHKIERFNFQSRLVPQNHKWVEWNVFIKSDSETNKCLEWTVFKQGEFDKVICFLSRVFYQINLQIKIRSRKKYFNHIKTE